MKESLFRRHDIHFMNRRKDKAWFHLTRYSYFSRFSEETCYYIIRKILSCNRPTSISLFLPNKKWHTLNLAPSPSARTVNSSQLNGTNPISRNLSLSTTNQNSIPSPFSPLNNASNHIDQNSQSMSPKLENVQQPIPNPTTVSNIDPSISVCLNKIVFLNNFYKFIFIEF